MTQVQTISLADREAVPGTDMAQVLVESWVVSERTNQIILEHVNPAAWRAKLPGSKTRTIVAIVTHIHNVRRKWLRLSVPHLKPPPQLDRATCTQKQAREAFAESGNLCAKMIADALTTSAELGKESARKNSPGTENPSATFHRDGWAQPWPAGAAMVTYMIKHEAHHRGQICMLAHQLGYPLPAKAAQGIWGWEKLWKDCGFTHPR
jgi:uncharacterized damage-inducible protein DinB